MSDLTGPIDVTQADLDDGVARVDLGGLLVPTVDGIEVQVQVDQGSGNVVQLTFVLDDGAVQVQAYAAPKSGGLWETVRPEIKSSINQSGGLVEEAQGAFGIELNAQVAAQNGGLQPARFTGIDGPRWFLRCVFLGSAARPSDVAVRLEEMVRGIVVVRGIEAMPSGAPIPLRLPNSEPASDMPPMTLPIFERGPEITETR